MKPSALRIVNYIAGKFVPVSSPIYLVASTSFPLFPIYNPSFRTYTLNYVGTQNMPVGYAETIAKFRTELLEIHIFI